ncbi:MAG: ion transporter [bacterium]
MFYYTINFVFIYEAIFKIISLGFFMNNGCYLTDNWNRMDFMIVCLSIVDMSI